MTRKLWALAGFMMGLAAAVPVTAQEWTPPYWKVSPDPELGSVLYPGFALLIQASGNATIKCWVEADGHPYVCEVVQETPRGLGFGSAARVMVASAEVGIGRIDGQPVPTTVQTTIRFRMPERNRWDGPEPSETQLRLAREILQSMPTWTPPDRRETMMDGLDFDRRAVVGPWIDELLPRDLDADLQISALQMGRLYSEAELRRVLAGGTVPARSPEEFAAACPDLTPEEEIVIGELRRRFCDRYGCEVTEANVVTE